MLIRASLLSLFILGLTGCSPITVLSISLRAGIAAKDTIKRSIRENQPYGPNDPNGNTGFSWEVNGPRNRQNNNYTCVPPTPLSIVCQDDTKELATAETVKVCGPRMSNCHSAAIQKTAGLDRICYSPTGLSGFCWFEDPNG